MDSNLDMRTLQAIYIYIYSEWYKLRAEPVFYIVQKIGKKSLVGIKLTPPPEPRDAANHQSIL